MYLVHKDRLHSYLSLLDFVRFNGYLKTEVDMQKDQ